VNSDSKREVTACEAFQHQLPELMQMGEDPYDHPHPRKCERCRELLDDLEKIAETARHRFGPGY
jgi:hypothetical protein